jgi:hypothetical protein
MKRTLAVAAGWCRRCLQFFHTRLSGSTERPLIRTMLSFIRVSSGMSLFYLLFFIGPFAWILRDGLGPDSTTSGGWHAIVRMLWCFYWGPATILAGLVWGAACAFSRRLKHLQEEAI